MLIILCFYILLILDGPFAFFLVFFWERVSHYVALTETQKKSGSFFECGDQVAYAAYALL